MNVSSWVIPGEIFSLGSTGLLFSIFLYLSIRDGSIPMRRLSLGWGIYGIRFILELLQTLTPQIRLLDAGIEILVTASSYFIVTGARLMFGRPVRRWPVSAGAMVVILAVVSAALPSSVYLALTSSIAGFLYAGGLFVWVGIMFLRLTVTRQIGGRTTGALFILWGLHKLDYPFIHTLPGADGPAYLLAALLGMGTAISILLHYLEIAHFELIRSEERSRLLSSNARDLVFRYATDPEPHFEYVSPSCFLLTGFAAEELYEDPSLILKAIAADDRAAATSALEGKESGPTLFRVNRPGGGTSWLELLVSAIHRSDGSVEEVDGIARDVTSRLRRDTELQAQREQLERAVKDRDEFLQELHHRVNNNLSIILSLVDFELREYGETAAPMLRKIQRRVMSIALVHSLLYRSGGTNVLDFGQYCRQLVDRLLESRPEYSMRAEVELDIVPVSLEIDTIKTCGLIVTELVDNAFEHAYGSSGGTRGLVKLGFAVDDAEWLLSVQDSGVGLEIDDTSVAPIGSGLHLVRTLCEELDARLSFQVRNGVLVTVRFPRLGR